MKKKTSIRILNNTIIISPSGNFYGSEQVLFDFLTHAKENYIVYLPIQSVFLEKILVAKLDNQHRIKVFRPQNLYILYSSIGLQLLFGRKGSVYLNEGGHIRWIKLLAKIFPKRKFISHLRLLEDVKPARLGSPMQNIQYIIISNFLEKHLAHNQNYHLVHDAYIFSEVSKTPPKRLDQVLRLGIIGRVSISKGLEEFKQLFSTLNPLPESQKFEFHFYGDIMKTDKVQSILNKIQKLSAIKIIFHGFVEKSEIYSSIDAVIHLNTEEPLGRIYFEALSHELPFIGFKEGGIGELSTMVGDTKTMIEFTRNSTWTKPLIKCLNDIDRDYASFKLQVRTSKKRAETIFSINNYVQKVSQIIND